MKLIHDIIIRRLDVSKDFELNEEYIKSIWNFYQVYKICLNVLGIEDSKLKKKSNLIKQLIFNPDDLNLLYKLKEYMSKDSKIIEIALNSIEENEDIGEIFEDFYPVNLIGVNIDDRSN